MKNKYCQTCSQEIGQNLYLEELNEKIFIFQPNNIMKVFVRSRRRDCHWKVIQRFYF